LILTVMTTADDLILSSLETLSARLPAVRDGGIDAIHDARVATRRLRAALPLLGAVRTTSEFDEVTPVVKALGRELGRAREQDESLRVIEDIERRSPATAPATATMRARLVPQQLRQRRRLIKTLESLDLGALDRLRSAIQREARRGARRLRGSHPFRSELAMAVTRCAEIAEQKVHHASGVYFPNRAHHARVAIKKLRYVAELLEPDDRVRKPALRALRAAQEALGRVHDYEMARQRLNVMAEEEDVPAAPELARVLEAECRSIFEAYRTMRPAILSAAADLRAWSRRSVRPPHHRRVLLFSAVALPSAAAVLASRVRRAG
jgi:CHAD domain-containing protein